MSKMAGRKTNDCGCFAKGSSVTPKEDPRKQPSGVWCDFELNGLGIDCHVIIDHNREVMLKAYNISPIATCIH